MNAEQDDYGPPVGQADLDAFAVIAGAAFNVEPKDQYDWMERSGHQNIRLLRHAGAIGPCTNASSLRLTGLASPPGRLPM